MYSAVILAERGLFSKKARGRRGKNFCICRLGEVSYNSFTFWELRCIGLRNVRLKLRRGGRKQAEIDTSIR